MGLGFGLLAELGQDVLEVPLGGVGFELVETHLVALHRTAGGLTRRARRANLAQRAGLGSCCNPVPIRVRDWEG